MDKKMHFFRVVLGILLTSFMYTPNTQAVDFDVCALKTLYAWNSATAVCPDTCKDLNFTWTGRWLENEIGMHCTSNTADSICGCSNTSCCDGCNNAGINCNLNCGIDAGCGIRCEVAWKICQNNCGGCPSSKEEKTTEKNIKKENKKSVSTPIPYSEKKDEEASSSASETKKSLKHEESPNVKELPNHEERPSKT